VLTEFDRGFMAMARKLAGLRGNEDAVLPLLFRLQSWQNSVVNRGLRGEDPKEVI